MKSVVIAVRIVTIDGVDREQVRAEIREKLARLSNGVNTLVALQCERPATRSEIEKAGLGDVSTTARDTIRWK